LVLKTNLIHLGMNTSVEVQTVTYRKDMAKKMKRVKWRVKTFLMKMKHLQVALMLILISLIALEYLGILLWNHLITLRKLDNQIKD